MISAIILFRLNGVNFSGAHLLFALVCHAIPTVISQKCWQMVYYGWRCSCSHFRPYPTFSAIKNPSSHSSRFLTSQLHIEVSIYSTSLFHPPLKHWLFSSPLPAHAPSASYTPLKLKAQVLLHPTSSTQAQRSPFLLIIHLKIQNA